MGNGLFNPIPPFPLRVCLNRPQNRPPGDIFEIRSSLATLPNPAAICSSLHIPRYIGHHRLVVFGTHDIAWLGTIEEASDEECQVPTTSGIYRAIIAYGSAGLHTS
jgi:hypothetical protein